MRAVTFTRCGGPDVLDVVEVPRPAAGPGQVVVAVVTAATNPGEIGIREGHFCRRLAATSPRDKATTSQGTSPRLVPVSMISRSETRFLGSQPGETIVVSAAAGGVGIYAAQLVRLRGADVIGTCGETNLDLLASLGIRPAQYGPGLSRQLRDLAPNGVDGYVDTFGSGNVSLAVSLG